jgi:hypothetical protein
LEVVRKVTDVMENHRKVSIVVGKLLGPRALIAHPTPHHTREDV